MKEELYMFRLFKRLKEKSAQKLKAYQEKCRNEFLSYVNATKDQNSTMETMYLLINGLELDITMLLDKYDLEIDFDYFQDEDYYEVRIFSSSESDNDFYLSIGTEEGKNTIILEDSSLDDYKEMDADQYTTNEILDLIINQIESYYSSVSQK